ncbi:MAG: translation initiation factor IF-2 [Patescibacteria group bacterium]
MSETQNKNLSANWRTRSPIVVVMGHVDHGKTSLLDFIRKTNIIAKEAGGITQSIGAYEIKHPSAGSGQAKKITFIDTPGHEAFSKMRGRGAKVADLAILVVAAEDGVKPQTKESIEIIKETKTPFVVAINKIDKPNADIEKTKNDLMVNGVLLEGYGGNISWQAISAKTGQGINELLDLILLAAEMENLAYNPDENASGIIIEAKADSRSGIIVSAIVKNGVLKTNDKIATASAWGKIKNLENFLGKKVNTLSPSSPAIILGFETLPQIGEEFTSGKIDLIKFQTEASEKPSTQFIASNKGSLPELNLILKADVSGSLETLSEIIKTLESENVKINILNESIGEITDGDIKSASSSNAIIIGFRVKTNKIAENLAKTQNVKIISSEIIYELVESIQREIKLLETPLPQGELEILKIFSQKGKKQLIGGKVIAGKIKNNNRLKITRENNEIGFGKITSLKKYKQEVNEVLLNEECGLVFESDISIIAGDRLIWQ